MAEDSLYGYTKNDEGVGLFIDWENIKIGLNDKYGLTPEIGQLLEVVDRFGQRGVSRAYANWQQHKHLHDDQSKFLMRAVETVQILGRNPHSGRVIKNSADVALAVEAVRVCYTQPDVTTFVLVTGDGDLVHLVNELKRNRNRVIIVGVDLSISKVLVEAADEVLVYETDIEPERFAELLEQRQNNAQNRSSNSRNSRTRPNTRSGHNTRNPRAASGVSNAPSNAGDSNKSTPKVTTPAVKKDVNLDMASAWILEILKKSPDGLSASNLGHQLWKKHKFTAKDIDLSLEDITSKLIASEKIQQDDKVLKLPPKVSKLELEDVDKTQHKTWLALEDLLDEQTHLNLNVAQRSEEGIYVDLASLKLPNYKTKGKHAIKGFIPKGQLDTKRVESVDDITDDVLELRILNLEPTNNLVTLSRSAVLSANFMNKSKAVVPITASTTHTTSTSGNAAGELSALQEGELITAKVTKLMPYGVFVDTGKNVKGLVHISELSSKQIRHPKQAVSVGDELELKVLSVDADKEHIALSLIAARADQAAGLDGSNGLDSLNSINSTDGISSTDTGITEARTTEATPDLSKTQPVDYTWEEIVEKFPEGTEVEGTVSNQTPFGVFVALEPGLSALMHVSELGKNPSAFRRGRSIKAVVANLDHDKQRFSLKPLGMSKTGIGKTSTGKTEEANTEKPDVIEQFKMNTEISDDENLALDAEPIILEADVSPEETNTTSEAKEATKPLDIGVEAIPEDEDYSDVFSTASGTASSKKSSKVASKTASKDKPSKKQTKDSKAKTSTANISTANISTVNTNSIDSIASIGLTGEEAILHQLVSDLQNENRSILSLNDLYQEYAKANGNQGNLQDFKKLIKKGHESGWLKLLRHSEDKGLYIQLNQQEDSKEPVGLA